MTSSKVLMAVPMCRAAIAAYPVGFADLEAAVAADVVSPSRGGWRWTSAASSAASSCPVVAAVRLEPDFRGSTLHDHQLAGHSAAAAAAVGFAAGFVAAFVAFARGIVAASASSFADDLIVARAAVAVVQVAAVNFAAGLAVAGFAAAAAAVAVTSDQEYLLALTQVREDPMVLL